MKLFTFSGISGTLAGTNEGLGLIELANDVLEALPASLRPEAYTGTRDVDHFPSDINLGKLLGVLQDAVRLTGATALNEEAARLSPQYGEAMLNQMSSDDEEVLVLAHSQGTNNLTWTLLYLARNHSDFFENRTVRCAFFDPKVGPNYVSQIFGIFPKEQLSFLFFQSEKDTLANQGMMTPEFIRGFVLGDHIWVRGLDHGTIREWASLDKPQRWLNRPGFLEYEHAWYKKLNQLRQETRGGQIGTVQLLKLDKWTAQYARDEMNLDKPSEALIGFLRGRLPAKYKS